ncbi:MAG: tRNA wybutosine-synthesizing 3 family protein, partial [Proteobacteria bacterium]|nr:tRNA wybutosine-synthesizing 3 family protein [Pseudomonadota bacterium]
AYIIYVVCHNNKSDVHMNHSYVFNHLDRMISFPTQESSLSSSGTDGSGGRGYAYFKFEPFVIHVMCRTLEDARTMVRL